MNIKNTTGRTIHVNMPLADASRYAELILGAGLAPEIGLDAQTLETTPQEEYEVWAERFSSGPVTIHAPFMDLAPGGIDPAVVDITRARLVRAAELAVVFKAQAMVCHPNFDLTRYPHNHERWLDVSARTWELVLEASAPAGTVICLENVYETDPDLLLKQMERFNDPRLGICFDTGHHNTWAATPLLDWTSTLGPWLKRLHLHDNDGSFDQHLPVGWGNFDFQTLDRELSRLGVRPGLTIEPHEVEHVAPTLEGIKRLLPALL